MSKQFLVVIAVIILGLFGILALTKKSDNTGGSGSQTSQGSNHTTGASNKGVTLVEYGDFQCPACKSFYPLVKQIKKVYGDDITFQFMHFPLTQIHPNAMAAARAAEAAGSQGKFFEMHDLLYENQEAWSQLSNPVETFESYAQQLELNLDQFKADVASAQTGAIINADIKSAQGVGASSTPTFVLNGQRLEKNPSSLEEFKQLINDEITKNNQ